MSERRTPSRGVRFVSERILRGRLVWLTRLYYKAFAETKPACGSQRKRRNMDNEFAAFVAIDWADQKHFWALELPDSTAANSEAWIIHPNRWTSGLPSFGSAFRESWWLWLWNNLAGRWYSC